MERVSEDDFSNDAFPYRAARYVTIGEVPTLAIRLSYVGELGWELYAPTEFGLRLWDALWQAGKSYGLVAAGLAAFTSLRIEKGYRLWGADIHTDYNPYEAGLGFAVRLKKGDFLGRDPLLHARANGLARKLCCMTLDDREAVVLGDEPILDGERVLGHVTSADYGYSMGRGIVFGYLPVEHSAEGTKVGVLYFDRVYTATVVREPLYDPSGAKLKS